MRRRVLFAGLCLSLVAAGVSLSIQSAQAATKTKTFHSDAAPGMEEITINDNAAAAPYPSEIEVSGFKKGKIKKVQLTITGLDHSCPNVDLDILLVGPTGQQAVPMSDIGGACSPTNDVDLVFQDGSPELISPIVSGTYGPTDNEPGTNTEFPGALPLATESFRVFKGTDPNGTWSLFVRDDAFGDIGTIEDWSLKITAEVK